MRTMTWWRWMVTLVALALVLGACGGADSGDGDDGGGSEAAADAEDVTSEAADSGDAPEGDPIVIGGTLGLTGAFSGPSAGYRAAYEFWADKVNAEGGLLGRPVELLIYDDESTPNTAQTLYQRLINQDEVDLLLAPYTTFVGGAVLPIVEQNEMMLFNGGFVGIDLFTNSDWMVGTFTYQEPDYPRGVFEMIDSLPDDQKPQRIGIATAQNPFTLLVRDGYEGEGGVKNFAEERGIDVVVDEEYAADATDVTGILQRAQAQDVDAFFALALPNDAALLARTAQNVGFSPDIYCSCGSQVTSLPYWSDLGAAGDGVMSTAMSWPSDDYPGLDELTEYAQDELDYAEVPVYLTGGYAIMQVLQEAVEEVGEIDQAALRDYVTNQTIDTVVGPITYDENRIPEYSSILVQYQGDHNEVVWPPDRATAEPRIPMDG